MFFGRIRLEFSCQPVYRPQSYEHARVGSIEMRCRTILTHISASSPFSWFRTIIIKRNSWPKKMTTLNRLFRKIFLKRNIIQTRNLTFKSSRYNDNTILKLTCVVGGTIALYTAYKIKVSEVHASQIKSVSITYSFEFRKFASTRKNGKTAAVIVG